MFRTILRWHFIIKGADTLLNIDINSVVKNESENKLFKLI